MATAMAVGVVLTLATPWPGGARASPPRDQPPPDDDRDGDADDDAAGDAADDAAGDADGDADHDGDAAGNGPTGADEGASPAVQTPTAADATAAEGDDLRVPDGEDPALDLDASASSEPEAEGIPPEPDFDDGPEVAGDQASGPPPEPDFGADDLDGSKGPPPEPELGGETDYDPLRDSPEWAKARGWSRAGVVALATGGALLIGAVAMGTSDPGAFGAGNNNFEDARNRAALLMGVPAGILIAGGAAMLGYGQSAKKRLRLEFGGDAASVRMGLRGRF